MTGEAPVCACCNGKIVFGVCEDGYECGCVHCTGVWEERRRERKMLLCWVVLVLGVTVTALPVFYAPPSMQLVWMLGTMLAVLAWGRLVLACD